MSMLGLIAILTALFIVTSWLTGVLVLGAWRVAWRRESLRPILERAAPLAILLSVTVGVALTLAASLPLGSGCHCGDGTAAALHICFAHPERSLSLLALALLPLLAVGMRMWGHFPALMRRMRAGMLLGRGGRVLNKVKAPIGNAFSLAFPRPRIIVDATWWSELASRERRIVLAHECAHLRRGDPRLLELLGLAALLLPRRLASRALGVWRNHAERQADAAAARAVDDPTAVASLLVGLHRRALAQGSLGFALQDGVGLEGRVRALLDGSTVIVAKTELVAMGLVVLALGVWIPAAFSEPVHVFAESILGLLP